jgi:isochorismate hydrolase
LGVSPCFLSKNAQKLPGYIERAAIPAYNTAVLGAVLPKKARMSAKKWGKGSSKCD